ncbi:amino acid adenylation domain-containing protein, partial [Lysinibacillus mangiferihumi]
LANYIPAYMIPAYFVEVESFPVTTHGKLDQKALPNPKQILSLSNKDGTSPRNALDRILVNLWEEILGIKNIKINDDFFDLGGHSLKVLELTHRLHEEYHYPLSVGDVFQNSVLVELSDVLSNKEKMYETIPKSEIKDSYELSATQLRLFIIDQLEGVSTAYNMPAAFYVEGNLNISKLETSLRELIKRHEILRTTFHMDNGKPYAVIREYIPFNLEVDHGITDQSIVEDITSLSEPFELSQGPLLRVKLFNVQKNKSILFFDMHHIISDGISVDILLEELLTLYCGKILPHTLKQYRDYAEWNNALVLTEEFGRQENFWLDYLNGELPVLDMPFDYPRPANQSFEGDCLNFELTEWETQKVKDFAEKHGMTPYIVLLSAYYILLSKYSNQEDIIIGTPITGRSHPELKNMIGMFVNTIVLRGFPNEEKTFISFLDEMKKNVTMAFQNQDMPLERIIGLKNYQRDPSKNPIFSTMFSYRQEQKNKIHEIEDMFIKAIPFNLKISKFDFSIEAAIDDKQITFEWTYCTKLFKKQKIKDLGRHYINLLNEIINDSSCTIGDLNILSREDSLKQFVELNSTKKHFMNMKPIYQMIEEQSILSPNSIAVEFLDQALTYSELNGKANNLAIQLKGKGIGVGSYAPVLMDRSLEMIISILAIMKTGAAFVPLDVNWPEDRILSILHEVTAKIVLVNNVEDIPLNNVSSEFLMVDNSVLNQEKKDLGIKVNLDDTIYVIFTSGSTGKPKGVIVPHLGIANRFLWMNDYFGEYVGKSVLQTTHQVYDSAVWQLFWPLTVGGKTVIPDPKMEFSAEYISSTIEKYKVTLTDFVPSVFNIIVEQLGLDETLHQKLDSLGSIIVGGEEVKLKTINEFQKLFPNVKISNLYGPTEASIGCIYYEVKGNEVKKIPIGKPISNVQILILDKQMKLVPYGSIGEIYISGLCLSKGYLNDPEKTKEVFKEHPFPETGWSKVYKTGDLARYSNSGNIEFIGRTDYQVKIRGLRIELGEIEFQLVSLNQIHEAVVVEKIIQGQSYLCAYIVSNDKNLEENEIRYLLSQKLPQFMIPQWFVFMEKLPLTAMGKVDRKSLPEPERKMIRNIVKPENKIEEELLDLWGNLLATNEISTIENFFAIGGNSLSAISLCVRIRQKYQIDISLKTMFKYTTIKEQAAYIFESIEQIAKENVALLDEGYDREINLSKGYYNASSSQKSLYILNRYEGISTSYNLTQAYLWEGELDRKRLKDTLQRLVDRHESLRTYFKMQDGEILQKIIPSIDIKIEYKEVFNENVDALIQQFVRPFDLDDYPLFRFGVLKLSEKQNILIIDMHHIISDGISVDILLGDFIRLYEGESLPKLKYQYKDYAQWQVKMLSGEVGYEQEKFWLKQFNELPPVLQLPTDYERPEIQRFEGDIVQLKLSKALSKQINQLTIDTGSTLYMVLLASYSILLSKYSGQEDIVIGTPVAGRSKLDFEQVVGMFVNTLPMRNKPSRNLHFIDYLSRVKENAIHAFEHQDYPLEELVRKLNISRDASRNVLFDTMLAIQNLQKNDLNQDDFHITPLESNDTTVKFDLVLTAILKEENIYLDMEYAIGIYKKESVSKMLEHLQRILEIVTLDPKIILQDIELLTSNEINQLLVQDNNGVNSLEVEFDFN